MVSPAVRSNLVAAIADICRTGLDVDDLRARLLPRIRRAVPVDAVWWAVADPATLLFNRAYREEIPAATGPYFVRNEFLDDDVNKWTDLARDPRGVRTLWQVTGGQLELSARYREIFQPLGLGDEMRAVLRTDGECWGYLCMHREGTDCFSDEEAAFVATVAPHLAAGFRLAMLMAETRIEGEASPGVVVLAGDGSPVAVNAAATVWLEEMGAPSDQSEVPVELLAVATRLLRTEGASAQAPRLRVRTRAGRWAVLHASWLGERPTRSVVVIIEEAAPREVLPLLMAAHRLTEQERKVIRLVCQGSTTSAIASRLHITTDTVQDHLKSIFAKTGVRSRGQLVATLLKQQYH